MKKVLVLAAACFALLLCGCSENEIGMTGMIYDSHSMEQYAAYGIYRAGNSNLSESGGFVPSVDPDYFDTEFEKHVNMSDPGDPYYHYILRGTEYGTELKARDLGKFGYNVAYSETLHGGNSDRKDYKLTISK